MTSSLTFNVIVKYGARHGLECTDLQRSRFNCIAQKTGYESVSVKTFLRYRKELALDRNTRSNAAKIYSFQSPHLALKWPHELLGVCIAIDGSRMVICRIRFAAESVRAFLQRFQSEKVPFCRHRLCSRSSFSTE